MQTFLPYPDFAESARVLDNRRLGKQRVEAMTLLHSVIGADTGWENHPAVKMWKPWPEALSVYGLYICTEWRRRGFRDTMLGRFQDEWLRLHRRRKMMIFPSWLGDEDFHLSHRMNLVYKDPEFYMSKFPDVDELFYKPDYIWPNPEEN